MFTRAMFGVAKPTPKQFVPQPNALRIDAVCLAIVGDLFNPPLKTTTRDLAPINSIRLAWYAHSLAKLMESRPCVRSKRRENVTKINCVVGESIEIGSSK